MVGRGLYGVLMGPAGIRSGRVRDGDALSLSSHLHLQPRLHVCGEPRGARVERRAAAGRRVVQEQHLGAHSVREGARREQQVLGVGARKEGRVLCGARVRAARQRRGGHADLDGFALNGKPQRYLLAHRGPRSKGMRQPLGTLLHFERTKNVVLQLGILATY